ncbi:MAG TPA: hypothetical protein VIY86_07460, partial [Pirellulaceae bacterium]
DEFLFLEPTDWETYVEFAALALELRYFARHELTHVFPAVRNWSAVEAIFRQDVDADALLENTRLARIMLPVQTPMEQEGDEATLAPAGSREPSPLRFRKWIARARRASAVGNFAKAAMYHGRAASYAPPKRGESPDDAGRHELKQLVHQLRDVLELSPQDKDAWQSCLQSVLTLAVPSVWTPEARLLSDLQKACAEYGTGVYRGDLWRWIVSLGKIPWRRPLPVLGRVLLGKYFRAAERRLTKTRLPPPIRTRLGQLLAGAIEHSEQRLRTHVRPLIEHQLNAVGLVPSNVPERVARGKLVEELLDQLAEHGYLNTGILRDALSKGDLKLPDLSGFGELLRGDRLLLADRGLAQVLDGVYRPAAIYLRWSQRLSSLAFGTPLGRFVTLHLALPFGGAFLALEGLRHLRDLFLKSPALAGSDPSAQLAEAVTAVATEIPRHGQAVSWTYYPAMGLTGVLIYFLMHRPPFRDWCWKTGKWCGRLLHHVCVEFPASLMRIPFVMQILHSPAYAAVRGYVFRPALWTLVTLTMLSPYFSVWTIHWTVD